MVQVDSATTYEISMRTIASGNVRRLKNSLYSKANTANRFVVIGNISKDNLKKVSLLSENGKKRCHMLSVIC